MTAAVLAAIGICVKPQLALIPIAVEVALLLMPSSRRRLRIEPLLFLAVGGLFLLAIHTFAPLYFSKAIPTTLSTYWAIGHLTAAHLIIEALQLHILFAVVLLLNCRESGVGSPIPASALFAGPLRSSSSPASPE